MYQSPGGNTLTSESFSCLFMSLNPVHLGEMGFRSLGPFRFADENKVISHADSFSFLAIFFLAFSLPFSVN